MNQPGLSDDEVAAWLESLKSGTLAEKVAARHHLARVCETRGMISEAIELLEMNVRDAGKSAELLFKLADYYHMSGRLAEGTEAEREAQKLSSQSSEAGSSNTVSRSVSDPTVDGTTSRVDHHFSKPEPSIDDHEVEIATESHSMTGGEIGQSDGAVARRVWRSIREDGGLAYFDLEDLNIAIQAGEVSLAPRQDFARNWAGSGSANLPGWQNLFYAVFMICWVWIAIIAVILTWQSHGWSSLWLVPISFVAYLIHRPWTSHAVISIVFLVTGWGWWSDTPFAFHAGLVWIAVWFFSNGWQNWCTDRFIERLKSDEDFFVRAYSDRLVGLRRPDGSLVTREITADEVYQRMRRVP